MTLHRSTPLPEAPARGRLIVPEAVGSATIEALRTFRGGWGRPHEGLVFWAGRRVGEDTIVVAAALAACEHGPQRVMAPPGEIGRLSRRVRSRGLAVVAQVHSHPGDDTRHSDGDDHLVLMPHEGMFSLVVARYGRGGLTPELGAGLHQFQSGRWVRVVSTADSALVVVPALLGIDS